METRFMGWSLFSLSHLHPAPAPDWKTPGRGLSLYCHSTDLPQSRKALCHVCASKWLVLTLLPAAGVAAP